MPITVNQKLQQTILDRADAWVQRCCREIKNARGKGLNYGNCIDDVQIAFSGSVRHEAYCAKFAWVLYTESCLILKLHPLLPKTAGARLLLDQSRSEGLLHVDTTPVPGCVFYRRSSADATGHIGTVINVDSSKVMVSAEGNAGDRIDYFSTPWAKVRDPKNGYAFIHTEESFIPIWYGFSFPRPVIAEVEN